MAVAAARKAPQSNIKLPAGKRWAVDLGQKQRNFAG